MKFQRLTLAFTVAITAFVLAKPTPAHSTVQTIELQACTFFASQTYWYCPVTGGDWLATSGATTAYVDFTQNTTRSITTSLVKKSFSGTFYSDQKTQTFGSGSQESSVSASNTKQNPSVWDYYFIQTSGLPSTSGSNFLYGAALAI